MPWDLVEKEKLVVKEKPCCFPQNEPGLLGKSEVWHGKDAPTLSRITPEVQDVSLTASHIGDLSDG